MPVADSFEQMPIPNVMSLRELKSETHKYFSKRDGAIAAIDAALQAAHNAPTVRARLLELQQAIQAFKDEKDEKHGTYLASKRNKKGAIDALADQVDTALAAPSPIHAQVRGPGNLAAQIQS